MKRYFFLLAAGLLLAGVASAETFGDPATGPLPNLTSVEVYDVTSEADKRTDGTLEDSGFNSTLVLNQSNAREYRFVMEIVNDGVFQWDVSQSDPMRHQGLNSSWNVSDIYYNYSGTVYDSNGGSFNSGTVSWDLTGGPTLSPDETLYANYLVEVDQNNSYTFQQRFAVNDSDTQQGSSVRNDLRLNKFGRIATELIEPPNDTTLQRYRNFTMNGSATCKDGKCSSVDLEARYNSSSTADSAILADGTPFETLDANPGSCDTYLSKDETCYVTWQVNSTGELLSYHQLDVQSTSNSSYVDSNDSADSLVQINSPYVLNLSFNTVDFGTLDPGSSGPASNNAEGYGVGLDPESSPADIWIKATELVSNSDSSYTIPPDNMNVSETSNQADSAPITGNYTQLKNDASPGNLFSTYYWLNVPPGIINGEYTGEILFKANST